MQAAIAALLGLWPLGSATAMADASSLDCAAPDGPVDELICKNDTLLAADAKLASVFEAAQAKAAGDPLEAEALVRDKSRWTMQRRDVCVTVDEPEICLSVEYADRISELQTAFALVPVRSRTSYRCDDDPSVPLTATVYETEPPTVRLERDGAMLEAFEVPAEKGVRFEGEDVAYASDDGQAQITWIADELRCTADPAQ